jgi:hypothetical protein
VAALFDQIFYGETEVPKLCLDVSTFLKTAELANIECGLVATIRENMKKYKTEGDRAGFCSLATLVEVMIRTEEEFRRKGDDIPYLVEKHLFFAYVDSLKNWGLTSFQERVISLSWLARYIPTSPNIGTSTYAECRTIARYAFTILDLNRFSRYFKMFKEEHPDDQDWGSIGHVFHEVVEFIGQFLESQSDSDFWQWKILQNKSPLFPFLRLCHRGYAARRLELQQKSIRFFRSKEEKARMMNGIKPYDRHAAACQRIARRMRSAIFAFDPVNTLALSRII